MFEWVSALVGGILFLYTLVGKGVELIFDTILKRREQRGYTRGAAAVQAEWERWDYRRLRAFNEGRPFDEPPPSKNGNAPAENGEA